MVTPTQVPVSGPLAEFGPGFASELLRQGYTINPAGLQINLMTHLSCWLADEGLDVRRLSDTEVERYLRVHRAAPSRACCHKRARTTSVHSMPGRYRPPDTLMAFLEAL